MKIFVLLFILIMTVRVIGAVLGRGGRRRSRRGCSPYEYSVTSTDYRMATDPANVFYSNR